MAPMPLTIAYALVRFRFVGAMGSVVALAAALACCSRYFLNAVSMLRSCFFRAISIRILLGTV